MIDSIEQSQGLFASTDRAALRPGLWGHHQLLKTPSTYLLPLGQGASMQQMSQKHPLLPHYKPMESESTEKGQEYGCSKSCLRAENAGLIPKNFQDNAFFEGCPECHGRNLICSGTRQWLCSDHPTPPHSQLTGNAQRGIHTGWA